MSEREEWSDWIEHDGKGCPCVGMWVQASFRDVRSAFVHGSFDGRVWEGRARGKTCWSWGQGYDEIIRYRIRKPRGLTILESLLSDLPETVDA